MMEGTRKLGTVSDGACDPPDTEIAKAGLGRNKGKFSSLETVAIT